MPNPLGIGLDPNNRWKKGDPSANPGGRPKQKPFVDAIRRAIDQGDRKALDRIAKKLIELAEQGEAWAVLMVCERLDGKTPQEIKLTRDVAEMSEDEILAELAEVRAAAGRIAVEDAGAGESGPVH